MAMEWRNNMNKTLRSATAAVLMLTTGTWSVVAAAAPVAPEAALAHEDGQALAGAAQEREQVAAWLQRDDVRQQMTRLGVSQEQAGERVAALSDAEVRDLAGKLDEAPAAGGFLGAVALIFLVLLVTDILGLTKVFSFTRSVR